MAFGWQAGVALGLFALLFNLLLLPRLGGDRLRRPEERHPWVWGAVTFPGTMLALLLVLPGRPDVVAEVWGIVAVGDSLAGVVGRLAGHDARLPWHRHKSWLGTVTYAVAGGAAGAMITLWFSPASIELPWRLLVVGLAAGFAALVESAPDLRDDNLVPAVVAACVIWAGVELQSAPLSLPRFGLPVGTAVVIVHAGLAWTLYRLGAVNRHASVAGALIGVATYWGLGWRGWLLLAAMVGMGMASTRLGLRRKVSLGTAEIRLGRRSAAQVLAKGGVAAFAACLAGLQPDQPLWRLVFAGALAAATADTLASELGGLGSGPAFDLWTFQSRPIGSPGAVTLIGTSAAAVGALAMAACALTLLPVTVAAMTALAGLSATLLESLVAPALERIGLSTHALSNLLLTLAGAVLAGLLAG